MPKTEPVEQYELRMDLYELFHYMNHTLIFGVSGKILWQERIDQKEYPGTLCRKRGEKDEQTHWVVA
jgi:hypothetical protein